jgi:hypothetical protein
MLRSVVTRGTSPDAGGAAKSRCKTRSVVAKQSATTAAAVVSTVKAAKKKKKRKRNFSPPPAVDTSAILTPQSREVESEEEEEDKATEELPVVEDRPVRRSESPAARGSRSWCRRRRRMPSVKGWRRSELLPQHRRRCLC